MFRLDFGRRPLLLLILVVAVAGCGRVAPTATPFAATTPATVVSPTSSSGASTAAAPTSLPPTRTRPQSEPPPTLTAAPAPPLGPTVPVYHPLGDAILGRWMELGAVDTVVIEYRADGTVWSTDRPLLAGVHFRIDDGEKLTLTIPATQSQTETDHVLALAIDGDAMVQTNVATGVATTYARVRDPDDLANLIVAVWQGRVDPNFRVDFRPDGRVSFAGSPGNPPDASYVVLDATHIGLVSADGQRLVFEVLLAGETLVLRNDLDQRLELVPAE